MRIALPALFTGILPATAIVLAASMSTPALAGNSATTLATLLDRAQIENMLAAYYEDFNVEIASFVANGKWPSTDDLGPYYLENGTLEVKGMNVVARGRTQIDDFYRAFVKNSTKGIPNSARIYAAFTNPSVIVRADSATADVLWTFIAATNPKTMPQILSIGREHDELVKRNGHWYFKRRVVSQ